MNSWGSWLLVSILLALLNEAVIAQRSISYNNTATSLRAVRDGLGGGNLTDWETSCCSLDPCGTGPSCTCSPSSAWSGVVCESDIVVELSLSNQNFNGTIKGAVGTLTMLRVLDLSNNRIQWPIAEELLDLKQLQELNISWNFMSASMSDVDWHQLSSLTTFDASGNRFRGPIPTEWPENIKFLDLSNNELTGPIPSFLNLTSLMHLDLRSNNLSGPLTNILDGLPAGAMIDLRKNPGLVAPLSPAFLERYQVIHDPICSVTNGCQDTRSKDTLTKLPLATPTPPPAPLSGQKKTNGVLVIAAVMGVVFFFSLVLCLFCLRRLRQVQRSLAGSGGGRCPSDQTNLKRMLRGMKIGQQGKPYREGDSAIYSGTAGGKDHHLATGSKRTSKEGATEVLGAKGVGSQPGQDVADNPSLKGMMVPNVVDVETGGYDSADSSVHMLPNPSSDFEFSSENPLSGSTGVSGRHGAPLSNSSGKTAPVTGWVASVWGSIRDETTLERPVGASSRYNPVFGSPSMDESSSEMDMAHEPVHPKWPDAGRLAMAPGIETLAVLAHDSTSGLIEHQSNPLRASAPALSSGWQSAKSAAYATPPTPSSPSRIPVPPATATLDSPSANHPPLPPPRVPPPAPSSAWGQKNPISPRRSGPPSPRSSSSPSRAPPPPLYTPPSSSSPRTTSPRQAASSPRLQRTLSSPRGGARTRAAAAAAAGELPGSSRGAAGELQGLGPDTGGGAGSGGFRPPPGLENLHSHPFSAPNLIPAFGQPRPEPQRRASYEDARRTSYDDPRRTSYDDPRNRQRVPGGVAGGGSLPGTPQAGLGLAAVQALGGQWVATPGSNPDSPRMPVFGEWYTLEELTEATRGFSKDLIVGHGAFGQVYKGTLSDGTVVAVKSFILKGQRSSDRAVMERELKAEVDTLGSARHRNLVRLLGACIEADHRLLVYEFVPNGSLESWLYGHKAETSPLGMRRRLKIVVGTARGLTYLHEGLEQPVVHRDVKVSNVLLDAKWNARLADLGFSKMLDLAEPHTVTRVMGSLGYVAPEYVATGQLTDRSDVFSFGVLLLEVLTGRRPLDVVADELKLVGSARQLQTISRVVDLVLPRLRSLPDFQPEVVNQALELAVQCIDQDSSARPKISVVLRQLEDIVDRQGGSATRGTG